MKRIRGSSLVRFARRFGAVALRREICSRAVRTSLLVGSVLALINYGSGIVTLSLGAGQLLKIGLTYVVPYCVSTYSATMYALRLEGAASPAGSRPPGDAGDGLSVTPRSSPGRADLPWGENDGNAQHLEHSVSSQVE